MGNRKMSRRSFLRGMGVSSLGIGAMMLTGSTAFAEENGIYKPGTYSAKAAGMGKVTVTMTFDANSITDVALDVSKETPDIGQAAAETLRRAILNSQSAEIDCVAGATVTSDAVKQAAAACIAQAKGEVVVVTDEDALAANAADAAMNEFLAESVAEKQPVTDFAAEHTYDVVVVGAGTTGLPAAVSAYQAGAKVAVLQKTEAPVAQGMLAACVVKDKSTPIGMKQYVHFNHALYNYRNNIKLWNKYVENSEEAVNWYLNELEQAGYTNFRESDSRDHIYDDGNCYLRGTLFPDSMQGPTAKLAEAYADRIDFFYETPAVQLIREEGRVTGVVGKDKDGKYIRFNAAKGVILATGDYMNNEAMILRYNPDCHNFTRKQNKKTGDGHLMGMLVGAQIERGVHCKMIHGAGILREEPLLAVNGNGERFIEEDIEYGRRNTILKDMKDPFMWQIFDDDYYDDVFAWGSDPTVPTVANGTREQLANYIEKGQVLTANTLEELAALMGVDEERFMATIKRYNELCAEGYDLDFGKASKYMKHIDRAPFYATKRVYQVSAIPAGLLVNEDGVVLDSEDQMIEGLYAAGNCSGCFYGDVDYSLDTMGLSIGRCITTGYLAGKTVAGR